MHHEQVRREGHEFEAGVERGAVARRGQTDERGDHEEQEEEIAVRALVVADVAYGVDHDDAATQGEQHGEQLLRRRQRGLRPNRAERGRGEEQGGHAAQLRGEAAHDENGERAEVGNQDGERPHGLALGIAAQQNARGVGDGAVE